MNRNPLAAILGWLRAGYPDGVPPTDFIPLVALLTRSLTPEELDEIVDLVITENPGRYPDVNDVEAAIAQVKQAPPAESDVDEVAARLAAVGWPLGQPRVGMLSKVLAWLTAGYPQGVPPTDRMPLLAILKRRLSDDEVEHIVQRLVTDSDGRPIPLDDARALIAAAIDDEPSEDEVNRVRENLAAHGWPLATETS